MNLQWFLSGAVRQATAMRKHVQKILNHQRDILAPKAIDEVQAGIQGVKGAVAANADKVALQKEMDELEKTANKWLKPYPNAAWRENVEVLLVALTVAMGVRTFFLQPFKIPTGSMQPTLFGVTSVNLSPDFKIPTGLKRIQQWFEGMSYVHVVAEQDGELDKVDPPFKFLIFNIKQTIWIGGHAQIIWFPPDYGEQPLVSRARLQTRSVFGEGHYYHKGEDVIKLEVHAGDHLFVDRMTYNFRPPKLGEIIVFKTQGIQHLPQDQFYIKRLVALPGDRVQIGDDRHLIINGVRLTAATPHFEGLYAFNPNKPPEESHYSGHVNQKIAQPYQQPGQMPLAPLFPDQAAVYTVPAGHYMVMGDNTMNSLDSRFWGSFPATNIIGRAFFVYWPITRRFGWECVSH